MPASVNEFRAGHIARRVGSEEQHPIGDILSSAGLLKRYAGSGRLIGINWRVASREGWYFRPIRRVDHSGVDRVDPDAVAGCRAFHRGFREQPYTFFGRTKIV
jgi:hypothetical protein